jgi:hypothetical protein
MIDLAAFFKVLLQPKETIASVLQTTSTTEALLVIIAFGFISALFTKQIVWLTRNIKNVWVRVLVKWIKGVVLALVHVLFFQYGASLFAGTGSFHSNLVAWAYVSVAGLILTLLAIATLLLVLILFILLIIPILLIFKRSTLSDPLIKLIAAVLGSTYVIFFAWWSITIFTGAIQAANGISFWPALFLLVLPALVAAPMALKGHKKRKRSKLRKPSAPVNASTKKKSTKKRKSTKKKIVKKKNAVKKAPKRKRSKSRKKSSRKKSL